MVGYKDRRVQGQEGTRVGGYKSERAQGQEGTRMRGAKLGGYFSENGKIPGWHPLSYRCL